jgi:hypothetical protein
VLAQAADVRDRVNAQRAAWFGALPLLPAIKFSWRVKARSMTPDGHVAPPRERHCRRAGRVPLRAAVVS